MTSPWKKVANDLQQQVDNHRHDIGAWSCPPDCWCWSAQTAVTAIEAMEDKLDSLQEVIDDLRYNWDE